MLLTNVNHLLNKLDELSIVASSINPDIIAVTETWLNIEIADSVCSLPSYSIIRRDRINGLGGGVMLYVRNGLYYHCLDNLLDNRGNFEVVFISIRPRILPRPLSIIIVAVVYCPPWYDAAASRELCNYIFSSVDCLTSRYPSAGFLIAGDFNTLDTSIFNRHLCFKQVVLSPTRGNNILDKIFTNVNTYFSVPIIMPPIGKSDHNCVLLKPIVVLNIPVGFRTVTSRRLDFTTINNIACELINFRWQDLYYLTDCQMQADLFYTVLFDIVNRHAPLRIFKLKNNDKPWITQYFKQLVARRDVAYKAGSVVLFKKLRNQINRVGKSLKSQYYLDRVQCLKADKPRNWWQHIKELSGAVDISNRSVCFDNLSLNGERINPELLSDVINDFFVSVSGDISPVDSVTLSKLRDSLGVVPDCFIISEFSVYCALKHLKVNKSSCDELLSNRLLIDLADVLAAPICALINTSIRQGIVPSQWKIARVSPLPKLYPPLSVETDLRPISVTSGISKVAESFLCKFFNNYFDNFIDANQFGCTSSRSTVHALIKLSDIIFRCSDNSKDFIRILFVDFSKAFDVVDHNVLLEKFLAYDFPAHIIAWSMSFLQERTQFVSIRNNNSSCRVLRAGTPQGTRSGPNDFKLLINDLCFDIDYAKYVDDTTAVSVSDDPNDNSLQSATDQLLVWCNVNGMKINTKKTKEMLIYFGRRFSGAEVPQLIINGELIERVVSFKLLGVLFSSDLSWGQHVSYMLNKVAKRYYIIFQLARIGIAQCEIILIYCAIVRSILEYACAVWHSGLTTAQSEDIERVQKRCLRIIYPELSYRVALFVSGLERLDVRRENTVHNLFKDIQQPSHVLHNLLPQRPVHTFNTRDSYLYSLPATRTKRYSCSFIPYCVRKRY